MLKESPFGNKKECASLRFMVNEPLSIAKEHKYTFNYYDEEGCGYPCWIVCRDSFPVSKGHILLVSFRGRRTVGELDHMEWETLYTLLDTLRGLMTELYGCDGFNIGINEGEAAGQTVAVLHVHLIPRYQGDMADPRGGVRGVIPDKQKYGDVISETWKLGEVSYTVTREMAPMYTMGSRSPRVMIPKQTSTKDEMLIWLAACYNALARGQISSLWFRDATDLYHYWLNQDICPGNHEECQRLLRRFAVKEGELILDALWAWLERTTW